MYALPRSSFLRRSHLVNNQKSGAEPYIKWQAARVKQQLRYLGVSRLALLTMESRYLPHLIHPDEFIQGVVYGQSKGGFAMLVATDKRVIFLNKKPLYVNEDEITFNVVSGVSHDHAGFGTTITLHTRLGDYAIQTLNEKCAQGFVEAIERLCIEQAKEANYDY